MPSTQSRPKSLIFLLLVSIGLACRAGEPPTVAPPASGPEAARSTQPARGDAHGNTPATETPAAETPAAETPRIPARNVVELRRHVGREVTAYGHVGRTGRSRSGHRFLNFSGSELTAVCFPDDVKRFPQGDPATTYADQEVEVRGRVELYQGKLQIRVRGPEQLRIVEPAARPAVEPVELRKIGRETWLSPAGLRYTGRDPAGLTRVEHVARHARDIPDRDGPHGVFDGGEGVAFAVIDEAWKIAQQRRLRPNREGDRSSYTVPMNRRIGYLGGRSGAQRNHPPLNRVFIVFETGTRNIITAFPK